MITFRCTTDVSDDHRVVLTLPSEVPTGQAELLVTVVPAAPRNEKPAALVDWVEAQTTPNGAQQVRYPLRGSVVRYNQPTEPVAEGDWEALR